MDKLHLSLVISLTIFLLLYIVSRSMLILPVYGFSVPVHEQATKDALPFLKPEILSKINRGHALADTIHQADSSYHFDNCNFQEGTNHIYQEYTTNVVPNLDPIEFGKVLHASMDFYAHSNWVNMGKTNLVDDGDGLWKVIHPGDNIGGAIVLEGQPRTSDPTNKNFLPYPATIDLSNSRVPMVNFGVGFIADKVGGGKERLPGLITGVLPSPYPSAQVKCPLGSVGHWDSLEGPGLAKDSEGAGKNFYPALDLAKRQVKHEWCRLVNLVKQSPSGDAGVNKLYNEWVKNDDDDQYNAACSTYKGNLIWKYKMGTFADQQHEGQFKFIIKPTPSTMVNGGTDEAVIGKGNANVNFGDHSICDKDVSGSSVETFSVQGTYDPKTEKAKLQITNVSPSTFYPPETGIENKLAEGNPPPLFDLDLSTGHGFFEKTYYQPVTPLTISPCKPAPTQPPPPSPPGEGPCSLFGPPGGLGCHSASPSECSEWKLVDEGIGPHMVPTGIKCPPLVSRGSGQDTPEKKTVADDITIYTKLTVDKVPNEEGMPANPQTSPVSVSSAGNGPPNLGTSPNALSSNQINNKSSVLEAINQNVTNAKNTAINITLRGTSANPNADMTASIITQPAHGTLSQINPQTRVVTYTPNQDYVGSDNFTFKINDGRVDSNKGTVSITINNISASKGSNSQSQLTLKQPQPLSRNAISPSSANDRPGIHSLQSYKSNLASTIGSLNPSSNPSVGSVNHQPVANVGPNQTVNESATVVLLGIASDPDPNSKISYSWEQIAGPVVTLKASNTTTPTFVAPSNTPPDTELKFTLRAIDDKGVASTNPAIVTIKVKPVNHPPISKASSNQTVNAGYVATLNGSKSKDPDIGDTLTYSWIQTAGPKVTLDSANSHIATFTAPKNISADTQMMFRLTVKDSENATSTDVVKVIDRYIPPVDQPPTADAGTNRTADVGEWIGLDGRGSRDPNGSMSSYSWMQTSGPAVTLNNANTSTPTFTAPNVSADTMLQFLLTVKDNRGTSSNNSAIATVTVKAAVQQPSVVAPVNTTGPSSVTTASNPIALEALGNALYRQGNYAQAMQYYDRALAIDPNFKEALNSKGSALNHQGNYAQAISLFDRVLAIDPNEIHALNDKGFALFHQSNYAEAMQYYDRALAVDPNLKEALNGKGNALYRQGNYAQAMQYYDRALAVDPNYDYALTGKQNARSKLSHHFVFHPYYSHHFVFHPYYSHHFVFHPYYGNHDAHDTRSSILSHFHT